MARKPRSDGFEEMVNADHAGAKESTEDVIADFVSDYDGTNAKKIARAIIKWLAEGDEIE